MHSQRSKEPAKSKRANKGDEVEIRFVPCPPEKAEAWHESMRLITRLLIEIDEEIFYQRDDTEQVRV